MRKIKFITEIASTHNGNPKIVEYLIKQHIKSDSDFIKFQIFKTEQLVDKKNKSFNSFKKIEIKYSVWEKIIKKYSDKTKVILEAFDTYSYNFCKKFRNKVDIKISTTETDNLFIIKDALKNFKKVFINISGYEKKYVNFIINKVLNKKNIKKVVFLYGFQGFPSKPKDLRFQLFDFFKKKKVSFGYSDHSTYGLSADLIGTLPLVINKKISYFEKHVCKNISRKPPDYISSLEFEDFKKLINSVKTIQSLNKNKIKISDCEKNYSNQMHKFAFSKIKLNKGQELNFSNLIFLRTSKKNGCTRQDFFNKKIYLKKKINKNSFLSKKFIIVN